MTRLKNPKQNRRQETMKPGRLFLFFLLIVILPHNSLCKIPIYKSVTLSQGVLNSAQEKVAVNFDKQENFWFGTAHNDSLFFLRIIFMDQTGIMKVMRGGLQLFFDPSGKRKRDISLKLERAEHEQLNFKERPEGRAEGSSRQRPNDPLLMIDKIFSKVIWTKYNHQFIFDRNFSSEPIHIDFKKNEKNFLVFEVTLHINELSAGTDLISLSAGIETGEGPAMQGGGSGSGMRHAGGEGGSGNMGGMGRMGGSGGMGGGRMGGQGGSPGGMSAYYPIRKWFLVEF